WEPEPQSLVAVPDILSGLRAEGSGEQPQAALRMVPASTGRLRGVPPQASTRQVRTPKNIDRCVNVGMIGMAARKGNEGRWVNWHETPLSVKLRRILDRYGCLRLRTAPNSIRRIRSRDTGKRWPIFGKRPIRAHCNAKTHDDNVDLTVFSSPRAGAKAESL